MYRMATGNTEKLDKISTGEILQKLKEADGNNTEFFYLYISTAGEERKKQKTKQLLPGQQTLNFPTQSSEDEESDDTDTGEDNDEHMEEESTASTSQPNVDIQVA